MSNTRQESRPGLVLHGVPHPNDPTEPGRPPNKYNRQVHEKIVELIRSGYTSEHVAAACGISRTAFADWLRRGREGDPCLIDFYEDVEAATGMAALKNEQRIIDGITTRDACSKCGRSEDTPSLKDRLAIAELSIKVAERRDGKNWNKQHNVVVRNELDGFLDDCQRLLPPKIYGTLLQIAASRGGEGSLAVPDEDD